MLTPWWNTTCATAVRARTLLERCLPSSLLGSFINQKHFGALPPLVFPEVSNLLPQLVQLGVTPDHANLLHQGFTRAIDQLDKSLSQSYQVDALKFCDNEGIPNSRSSFIQASQDYLLQLRAQFVRSLSATLLTRVQAFVHQSRLQQTTAQSRASSSSASTFSGSPSSGPVKPSGKPRGRATKFTKEQTAALNALLAHDNQYSHEDKELIAHELNLTREQVNRWFCNARARKKPYSCPSRRPTSSAIKSLSSNTHSSSPTDTPSTHVEQTQSLQRPSTSSSEDTEMIITASSSSSSQGEEDDSINAYFDFPAYQPESWSQQDATPLSVPPISFNFDYLNPSACSTLPHPSSSFADPQLWNQPTFNSQPFPY